jgi:Spy/CpxP family protein refolding chaperone
MLTRTLSRLVLPLGVALAAPVLGCGGVAHAQASSPEPTSRAPVASNATGPLKVVGEALGDVPLTSSQRTRVEQLAADTEARHGEVRSARKDLALALADEVQAGRIDRAALAPRIDALGAALRKVQPADRAAFEQLHAILGSDQRVAFVDALEAHMGERASAWFHKGPLKQWADDLKLTDDQKTQIRTALKGRMAGAHEHGEDHHGRPRLGDGGGQHERGAKVLAAFKQDRFVIDEVMPAKDVTKEVAHMSDRFLGIAEAVLPILTAEQRSLAAKKVRDRADTFGEVGPVGPVVE